MRSQSLRPCQVLLKGPGFNSGQGGTRGASGQPPVTSAPKGRYKASVEDDPDSPGNAFMTNVQATASAPSSRPTPASEQPTSGYAHPSASLRPATDHATTRTSPPSRAKDSPSHRAVESAPVPPAAMPPMVPTTSRAPLSAPPVQQSFSTQSSHQPTQRSVSHSFPPCYIACRRSCSDCGQAVHWLYGLFCCSF